MKFVAVIAAGALAAASASTIREQHEEMFLDHMHKFDLEFKDGAEFVQRLNIFISSVEKVKKHNSDKSQTYTLGINQFSHLTHAEYKATMLTARPPKLRTRKAKGLHGEPSVAAAASVDWNAAGAVTPIKNQGQCGSCWSFSTTGALEGIFQITTGTLQSFSEQELVSCDSTDSGCNGGWYGDAFDWIKNNGGIATESGYPYTAGQGDAGTCLGTGNSVSGSAPTGYMDVQANSISALESAVEQQPVSIAIDASGSNFNAYSGGVFSDTTCGQQLDHAVLAVGYGTSNGQDYWMVKNSWGESWGDNGFIYILKSSANLCGVMLLPEYPTL